MDSEGRFWIAVWGIGLAGFMTLAGCITVGAMQDNRGYYRAQSECVAKGGSWLPFHGGICTVLK